MKLTYNEDEEAAREKRENEFYDLFLEKAIQFANKQYDGSDFRPLIHTAAVITRTKQSRSATRLLAYQMERDRARGIFLSEIEPQKTLPEKAKKQDK